jgi:hypothetical protein
MLKASRSLLMAAVAAGLLYSVPSQAQFDHSTGAGAVFVMNNSANRN